MEPARGLEPLTARLQGGCHTPHLVPTSDYSHAAVPASDQRSRQLTAARTTNRTTELVQRGSRGRLAVWAGKHCHTDVQLTRLDASVVVAAHLSREALVVRNPRAQTIPVRLPGRPLSSPFGHDRIQSQGLRTRMPVSAKSLVLRVPSPKSYWRQMAAI